MIGFGIEILSGLIKSTEHPSKDYLGSQTTLLKQLPEINDSFKTKALL